VDRQQRRIRGLALLAWTMLGVLSIMTVGCGGSSDNSDSTIINQQTLVATWDVTGSHTQGFRLIGTISLGADGTLTHELMQINDTIPAQRPIILIGKGTWAFDGSSLTLIFEYGVVDQGTAQGDSTNFSMVCSNGWTLNFSRR
jgi:hypothetical protein